MKTLTIVNGDETVDISYTDEAGNETNIVHMNHDDDGWSALSKTSSAIEKTCALSRRAH